MLVVFAIGVHMGKVAPLLKTYILKLESSHD